MDERSFDNIIKQKIGDYEDPSFDETAFAQFQKRMSTVQRLSWYNKYRTEVIVISALMLFTLMNGYLIHSWLHENKTTSAPLPASTPYASLIYSNTKYIKQIDSLETLVAKLTETKTLPYSNTSEGSTHHALRNVSDTSCEATSSIKVASSINQESTDKIFLGDIQSLPISFISLLRNNDLLTADQGKAYLIIQDVEDNALDKYAFNTRADKPHVLYLPVMPTAEVTLDNIHEKNASAKVMNDLQKHYFHGLGINVAPHADLILNSFNEGNLALTPRVGVTFDWVVSPHFSLETSLDYMNTRFSVNDNFGKWEVKNSESPVLGSPQKITFATQNILLPISLKYRKWISAQNELIARTSFTSYYALRQRVTCSYLEKGVYGDNDDAALIDKTQTNDIHNTFSTTLGASIGVQHSMKSKNKIELSFFYEKSLGAFGPQHSQMQLMGLKAAYWIRLK